MASARSDQGRGGPPGPGIGIEETALVRRAINARPTGNENVAVFQRRGGVIHDRDVERGCRQPGVCGRIVELAGGEETHLVTAADDEHFACCRAT